MTNFGISFVLLVILGVSSVAAESLTSSKVQSFIIGNIEISEYIHDRELRKKFGKETDVSEKERAKWFNAWIDRLRFANLAAESGYLDHPQVLETVSIMADYSLVYGRNGPFFRKIIDPLLEGKTISNDRALELPLNANWQLTRRLELDRMLGELAVQAIVEIESSRVGDVLGWVQQLSSNPPYTSTPPNGDDLLYRFELNETAEEITVDQFLNEYRKKVIKRIPDDFESLRREIMALMLDQYLVKLARDRDLDKDERYLMEYNHFKQIVMANLYVDRPLSEFQKPNEEDLISYYEKRKEKYQKPQEVSVWKISGKHPQMLAEQRKALVDAPVSGLSYLDVLESWGDQVETENLLINEYSGDILDGFARDLDKRPVGWTSPIIKDGKDFFFYFKYRNVGLRPVSFAEVRQLAIKDVTANRKENRRADELLNLRAEYPLTFTGGDYGVIP